MPAKKECKRGLQTPGTTPGNSGKLFCMGGGNRSLSSSDTAFVGPIRIFEPPHALHRAAKAHANAPLPASE